MKKIILIPDSFKGTMSSAEICAISTAEIKKEFPLAEVDSIPVADGGEGSVDCFLQAMGGERIQVEVKGPFFENGLSFYGLLEAGKIAVIEMASCAGLPMVEGRMAPDETTTYGVGQLMLDAVSRGAKKLIIGLGGSCTNDGGCGVAAACGIKFMDKLGREFIPVGGTLKDICRIDVSGKAPQLEGIEIIAMCDIDNPLCGPQGAAFVFGPQKGADENMVDSLDKGLLHMATVIKDNLHQDVLEIPGAGAAGGLGAGMKAFFDADLQMGIEVVLDTVRFEERIHSADLVISGEGRIDTQSLRGKVVIGVARRTKAAKVPLVAIVGDIGDNIEDAYELGVAGIFSINRVAIDYSKARKRSCQDLALTVNNLMKFLKGWQVYSE